jgi:hypothetical protein
MTKKGKKLTKLEKQKQKQQKREEDDEEEDEQETNESSSTTTESTSVDTTTKSSSSISDIAPTKIRSVVTDIIYCDICTFPIEYCEFSDQWSTKCEKFLAEKYPKVRDELVQLRENDKNKNKKSKCIACYLCIHCIFITCGFYQ